MARYYRTIVLTAVFPRQRGKVRGALKELQSRAQESISVTEKWSAAEFI